MLCDSILKKTYIALQVIDLPGLDHVIGVWQAGPVVQLGSVVGVICLELTFLGQFNCQHVHWKVELGLGLVEVLLVQDITGNLGRVDRQHAQRVILDAAGTNVVTQCGLVVC